MQMRVSLMLALRRSRSLFFGHVLRAAYVAAACSPNGALQRVQLAGLQRDARILPRDARLEEMMRFMERLGLRAPSEQTFGVVCAIHSSRRSGRRVPCIDRGSASRRYRLRSWRGQQTPCVSRGAK